MIEINELYSQLKDINTTKELLSLGLSSNDLTRLVKENYLERIKKGYYKIDDLELLTLANNALIINDLKSANRYYNLINKDKVANYLSDEDILLNTFRLSLLYNNDSKYIYLLLEYLLNNQNYSLFLSYSKVFFSFHNNNHNYNYFAYLISYIDPNVKNNYKLKHIIGGSQNSFNIRTNIYNLQFNPVFDILNNRVLEPEDYFSKLETTLINKMINSYYQDLNQILFLVNNNEYSKALDRLNEMQRQYRLSRCELTLKKLLEDYFKVSKKMELEVKKNNSVGLTQAIFNNDYFNTKKFITYKNSKIIIAYNKLIDDITNLININNANKYEQDVNNICNYLINKDTNSTINCLSEFVNKYHLNNLEDMIYKVINYCLIDHDLEFKRLKELLMNTKDKNYDNIFKEYRNLLKSTVINNEEAKINSLKSIILEFNNINNPNNNDEVNFKELLNKILNDLTEYGFVHINNLPKDIYEKVKFIDNTALKKISYNSFILFRVNYEDDLKLRRNQDSEYYDLLFAEYCDKKLLQKMVTTLNYKMNAEDFLYIGRKYLELNDSNGAYKALKIAALLNDNYEKELINAEVQQYEESNKIEEVEVIDIIVNNLVQVEEVGLTILEYPRAYYERIIAIIQKLNLCNYYYINFKGTLKLVLVTNSMFNNQDDKYSNIINDLKNRLANNPYNITTLSLLAALYEEKEKLNEAASIYEVMIGIDSIKGIYDRKMYNEYYELLSKITERNNYQLTKN